MTESRRKVTYLAGFQCPSRVLVGGKAQVLCQQSMVYLCNGSEFVYTYNKEQKLLKAICEFPGKVWHIELGSQQGQLYALCAAKGIYCVSAERHGRSMNENKPDRSGECCPPTVNPVGSEDCILLDATIYTFMVVNDFLVTVSKQQDRWTIKKLHSGLQLQEGVKYHPICEVEIPAVSKTGVDDTTKDLSFLPFLCCVTSHTAGTPDRQLDHHRCFTVEASLFSLLFGVDAAMIHSPMILCGFPDGCLCCIPLKYVMVYGEKRDCKEKGSSPLPQIILYHLEQPVVYIGALRHQYAATDNGHLEETAVGLSSDCLVALGHQGKCVTITSSVKEDEKVLVYKEYHLGGPIVSGFCCEDSLYYSTHCNIFTIHKSFGREKSESMLAMLPVNLNICSAATMTLSSRTAEGDVELLALSANGRLMMCSLSRSTDKPQPSRMTAAKEGQKIKELLSRIGSVSDRVCWLKHAIEKKNTSLSHLNQVIHLSCALLSSQSHRQLLRCIVTTAWSHLLLQDSLMVSCCLENLTDFALEYGWTLCVHVSTCAVDSKSDSLSSATVYNFPITKLLAGNKMEVTFLLHRGQNGCLELPVTVSCMLFYSLAGILRNDLALLFPPDSHKLPCVDLLGDAVCLTLIEHVIDVLQCLRLHCGPEQGLAPSMSQSRSLPLNAVDTFLSGSIKPPVQSSQFETRKQLQDAHNMEESTYISPLVASVRLSSDLLKKALKEYCSGSPLCLAVLRWLLSDNARVDTLEAPKLSAVHGLAPDGSDVRLLVSEMTVNDLCPEGPISAVQIKMESSSLAVISSMHQAVLRRVQKLLLHDAPSSCSSGLQVKRLQQMLANNETLLKEAQSLRDQLCLGKDSGTNAAAERLLNIYRELRNPSLVIV